MTDTAFDRLAATLDPPMVVVTTRAGNEQDGCLVGFSTQCSIDPVRYLVCLSKKNRTYEIACNANTLVVHFLHDSESDRSVAHLFGEHTAHDIDKLAQCDWEPGPSGVPVITPCDWIGGPIVDRVELGDHVGFTLAVETGRVERTDERYLNFIDVRDFDAGNPP